MDIWYKCNREFVSAFSLVNYGTLGEEYRLIPGGILPTSFYVKLEGLGEQDTEADVRVPSLEWLNADRFEIVNPPTLTENQIEVMETLYYTHYHSSCPLNWCTPLDLGASNGSHHSNTLASLAKKGLVNHKQRGAAPPPLDQNGKKIFASRGSKAYRLTTAGTALIMQRHINLGRRCYDGRTAPVE